VKSDNEMGSRTIVESDDEIDSKTIRIEMVRLNMRNIHIKAQLVHG